MHLIDEASRGSHPSRGSQPSRGSPKSPLLSTKIPPNTDNIKKNGAHDQATSSRNVVSDSSGSGRRTSVPASAVPPANPSTAAPPTPLPIVDPRLSEQLKRLIDSLPIGTDAATAFAHLRANMVFSRSQNPNPTPAAQIPSSSPKSQISPMSNPPVHEKPNPIDIVDNYSGTTVSAEDLEVIEKGEDVEQPIVRPAEDTARSTSRLEGTKVELPVEGSGELSPRQEEDNHAFNLPSPPNGRGCNSDHIQEPREEIEVVEIPDDDMEIRQPLPSDILFQSRAADWNLLRTLDDEHILERGNEQLRRRPRRVRTLVDEEEVVDDSQLRMEKKRKGKELA